MSKPTSQADYLKAWQQLLVALAENAVDLPHLESRREKLQAILNEALPVFQEQAASTAMKQDASRRLEDLLSRGRTVATFLHAGIREHYGKRSEKLAEFRLQPFRGRRPQAETPEPPPQPEDAR